MTTTDPVEGHHTGTPTVLVRYEDFRDARHAIEMLEARGIDGEDLALVGEAAGKAAASAGPGRSDAKMTRFAALWIAVGVVLGALGAAALGVLIVGVLVLLWPGGLTDAGWTLALVTAWFAAGGAVLGAFFAVARKMGFAESWALTFENETGENVWLAIYTNPAPDRTTLAGTHPVEVRQAS